MIAKQIPMRVAKKSNFGELVQYIANSQNKQERVERITITNCHQQDCASAAKEIMAVQRQNKRAESDKTYHLMISFPAGENPPAPLLEQIETKVCQSLGFGEHQRISAVHTDTDHLHIHIAINKIHPHRRTIHNPYCDHKILGNICDKLEAQYNLVHDNHQPAIRGEQSLAQNMESAGGIESLLGWIRRECLTEIRTAGNWQELHNVLQKNGLALAERGNGLIITDGAGRAVKPSSVARDLSRQQLEKRFGAFMQSDAPARQPEKAYQPKPMASRQDTTALYADYRLAQSRLAGLRAKDVMAARNKKNMLIEAAKNEARQKRKAIKVLTEGRLNKKVLYHLTSKTLQEKLQSAREQYRAEYNAIRAGSQRPGWLDWLQKRAAGGDTEALNALRARKGNHSLSGNIVTGKMADRGELAAGLSPDSITRRGTVIYRVGASAVRDDGTHIKVSKVITQKALALSLTLALRRFGPSIKVEGTAEFKEGAAQFAAFANLPLTFEDPALEQRRQSLIFESQTQETRHEPHHRRPIAGGTQESGRRNRINHPRTGQRGLRKPHVARVGSQPPPQAKNRLRDMHELGMVRNTFGSELLLPGHVPCHVEQQQSTAVNGLRRDVPEPGRTIADAGEAAARQYVAEREQKRTFIRDIPTHTLWAGESGNAEYAGWREKDGKPLLLLKTDESAIIVLPTDTETLKHVKHLKIGDTVTFESDGTVQRKGLRL